MGVEISEKKDIIAKISAILEEIRPLVVGHGGNIELVNYEDGVVYVRLFGACTSCPFSLYTIKLGIEDRLKKEISDVISVKTVD